MHPYLCLRLRTHQRAYSIVMHQTPMPGWWREPAGSAGGRRHGQADVAARMRRSGSPSGAGRPWRRVENGRRRVTAKETAALAICLDVAIGDLVYPRDGGEDPQLTFPSGFVVSGRRLLSNDRSITWDRNTPVLSEPSLPDNAQLATEGAEKLMQRIVQQAAEKLASEGWTPPRATAQPVVAAIVTSRLGVLVGRRHDGKPPWTFIAGEVEPGERPEDAAIREVKEETGLRIAHRRSHRRADSPEDGPHG